MSDNIKVVVKVRPLISREIEEKQGSQWRVSSNTLYQLDSNGRDSGQCFTFDKVYNKDTKTSDVYNDVAKPIVEAATAGFNGTIFAYGQTSSGKTYTMMGTEESPGIIPLAVLNLFQIIKSIPDRDFLIRVSYIEIYNETVRDLLDIKKDNIRIYETFEGTIKADVTEQVTTSPEEVLEYMKQGEQHRQTGSTYLNDQSSRSHSIFQITIESREHVEGEEQTGCVNVSQLNLVDLAGSERAGQTGTVGIRFKEGTHINKSLSALALVIKQLSEDLKKYVNYRDSKLTRLLQNSLGGNAKTSIICAITPAALEETISTLQFATRAKSIKNKPEVNAVVEADKTMIQSLTKQLSHLQTELQNKKNLEVMLETKKHVEQDLIKQIANLQKLIINGFCQRQSLEHKGGARKQALRRQTISTIHSISGQPSPDIPKFRTPHLKYNAMNIPNPKDVAPMQGTSKLPSLPEEPPRLVTPPPANRKVHFKVTEANVIEIDSDDEASIESCSPLHPCYDKSKTPPCVLRKKTQEAERNYNEIIEFTKIEKMYEPTVVELMQKLELSTDMMSRLQDEIEALNSNSKQKDLEMEHLNCKIRKTEEELKKVHISKMELDAYCQQYKNKITDLEVSYETLQKKAKTREEDLLSLLENQKLMKSEEIGKSAQNNIENMPLIDISYKDISLVSSDNETSVLNTNDHSSDKTQELVARLQDELINKGQIILQLEADIASQKQSIEYLEQTSTELQKSVDEITTRAGYLEDENKSLMANIETLNSTIKYQKENLETVTTDMDSYKSLIQELQIKLSNRDNLLSMNINDSTLETMIANEESALANNENMKNLIHCFKIALDNRTKEVEDLKSSMTNVSQDKASMEELIEKTKQIEHLTAEIISLRSEINENISTIDNLIRDKKYLTLAEQKVQEKLSEVETQKNELYELSNENSLRIHNLKEENFIFKSQIETMSTRITQMEEEMKEKNNIVDNRNKEKEDYELKAKSVINKIRNVMSILSGELPDIPEMVDDLITSFNTMLTGLNALEQLANATVTEKKYMIQQNTQIQTNLAEIQNKYNNEITNLRHEYDIKTKTLDENLTENTKLKDVNNKLAVDLDALQKELVAKCEECKFVHELCNNFKVSENNLKEKLEKLQQDGDSFVQKSLETENLKCELNNKCAEVANLERKVDELREKVCNTIYAKVFNVLTEFKIEFAHADDTEINLEYISEMLNKLVNFTKQTDTEHAKNIATLDHVILNLKQENKTLVDVNDTLRNKLLDVEDKYNKLTVEKENKYLDSKEMNDDLTLSNIMLDQLKEDLRLKANEISCMETTAKEWQEKFKNLDLIMKEQMQHLQLENEKLKNRLEEMNNNTNKIDTLLNSCNDSGFKEEQKIKLISEDRAFVETMSPPSLVKICCNTIVETLEPKNNDNSSDTASSENQDTESRDSNRKCKTCEHLSLELRYSKQENSTLTDIIERLEIANKSLLQEQQKVRQEVQLLLEPAQELHKKIAGHKTNLSILTATTYAENKLLKSQVKSLQHHHNRFHNVCARDIPEFKRQLNDLLIMLKEESVLSDVQNVKRYSPNVLDSIKNESTLDGDLLMLDTNVTLTTTGDNTLVGCDHICLDITQTYNEASCQTNDIEQCDIGVNNQISVLETDSQQHMIPKLNMLKEENCKLKEMVDRLSSNSKADAKCSPIKISDAKSKTLCESYTESSTEIERLSQIVTQMQSEKDAIETKYSNLLRDMQSADNLLSKLNNLEKACNEKTGEITKLNSLLNNKMKELKALQEENDSLSTQVMENISEADDLNKELDKLKTQNSALIEKIQKLESELKSTDVSLSGLDDVVISDLKVSSHAKLNRSFSDSDTSTTYNKICTLQNELCAGREDCKKLTEDVATIKQHLNCSNMSVDLNDSTDNTKICNDAVGANTENQCNVMPNIQEERELDVYIADKNDCSKYYREITGIEENLPNDIKIVDIMKLFYNNLVAKHGSDLENLLNKLNAYEESKKQLQKQIDDMSSEYAKIVECYAETVDKKEKDLNIVSKMIHQLKMDIKKINLHASNPKNREDLKEIANSLKQKVLNTFDFEFGICCGNIFDVIITKYDEELLTLEKQCTALQSQNEKLISELDCTNVNLTELKVQMVDKEKEYNLLNASKLKMQEISSAVTLDIVKREQEVDNFLKESCQRLLELNLVSQDFKLTGTVVEKIKTMVDVLINQNKLEVSRTQESKNEILALTTDIGTVKDENNILTTQLSDKDRKVKELESLLTELNKSYNLITEENKKNLDVIDQLNAEKDNKTSILDALKDLKEENERLKLMNQMIQKEKEAYSVDLQKAGETIKQNNDEIGKMTSDILMLRESTKEATSIIQSLKQEVQKLSTEKSELKQNLEEKCAECSKLDTNLKTYDKSMEIQNRIIKRLHKQKEEDDVIINEKQSRIDEITRKCTELQTECQKLQDVITATREESELLKTAKEALESRVCELEEAVNQPRLSLEGIADASRRRRQSLHDSKRLLGDLDEHKNLEAVFESCQKHDDMFMDVDRDNSGSGRSTPFGFAKGRDSLLSRTELSDKGSEGPSRPSSAAASARRRRQSTHDAHRGVTSAPDSHDLSIGVSHSRDTSVTHDSDDVAHLKEQLCSVTLQLEELKEKYRELDEECEICGQYLQERDQRCVELKKENIALETQIKDLKAKVKNADLSSRYQFKPLVHVAVNTDEDWANLHSVVVDRMSFDAEVEKNKRLRRTVEELRYKNHELKSTLAKALDRHASKDTKELEATREQLEATKEQLESVKAELRELKVNYKALDEECETCAQYLRDSEQQCRKLREDKAVLESKVQKLQEECHASLSLSLSVREKRHTAHDSNRNLSVDQRDVHTQTTEELLSNHVERDSSGKTNEDTQREMKLLRMTVEKLSHQKAAMELQLRAQTPNPVYVATGSAIVQNQQLSDVMRENQRLKQKLANICKRLSKKDCNRENQDPKPNS